MKFLLDENFPRSAADLIDECGHEAVRFDDVCNSGDDDDAVHPVHAGIVVVALRQPNRAAIHSRLKWFMENVEEPLNNRVFILRDFSYRVR